MKRFSRREQILVGACAVVVLFIGAPMLWQAIPHGVPPAATSQRRLLTAREERASHAAMLARLETNLTQLAVHKTPPALAATAAAALDRRAREAGIRLREVKPMPPRLLESATAVPLQISFTAPFPRAARFLAGLRANPDGLAVDRVVIAANTSDSDEVAVNLRIIAFSLSEDSQEKTRGQS
jgi:Tfp pilus assembly protein PilO